jgi:hypothetical protein
VDAVRVLVTGSRGWSHRDIIAYELGRVAPGDNITLISGGCPTGADRIAEMYAEALGWEVEIHPADWRTHGKAAGPIRNAEMVASAPDVCLAFIGECASPRCKQEGPHGSHGATGCADMARAAGVPVMTWIDW